MSIVVSRDSILLPLFTYSRKRKLFTKPELQQEVKEGKYFYILYTLFFY